VKSGCLPTLVARLILHYRRTYHRDGFV